MRYRLCFEKNEEMIYISLLDFQTFLQRALRRAKIEMEFSNGFNPHPRIEYGPAVGLFIPSDGEYVDITTLYDCKELDIAKSLNKQLPKGLKVKSVQRLSNVAPALSQAIGAAKFVFKIQTSLSAGEILHYVKREDIFVTKKNKKGILTKKEIALYIDNPTSEQTDEDEVTLTLYMSQRPNNILNPNLIVTALSENFPDKIGIVKIQKGESLFF